MKFVPNVLALLLTTALAGCQIASAQETRTTLDFASKSDTQIHSVKVDLPDGYSDYPSRKYVTVYMFDSQSDAFFDYTRAAINYLVEGGYMDPVILVGVSSANRQYDFTPVAETKVGKAAFRKSGGAELYYKFVCEDIVPAVERKYRCEPFRIGIGHSLGGTFLIHCLLSHPGLFNACLTISPNLVYDEEQLPRRARGKGLSQSLENKFLYMANGRTDRTEERFRPATTKFAGFLRNCTVPGFHFVYESLANDSHGMTPLEGIPKGIVQLYRQFIYPDEAFVKQVSGSQSELVARVSQFYSNGSTWSGLKLPMVWDINNMGYNCYYSGHKETAVDIFKRGLAAYPEDSNLYDSLGDVEQMDGDLPMARKYYEQGLAVVERERSTLAPDKYRQLVSSFQSRIASLDKKP